MSRTTPAPRTAPALAVTELFRASPRLVTGFAVTAASLLILAALGSSIG